MKLLDVLRKECVVAAASANTKADALEIIVEAAKKCSALKHVSSKYILDGLKAREELGSTGFGGGIAIPHCRLPSVDEFVVGVITFKTGIPFDALDEEPVQLMVFIIAPDNQSDQHIRILSGISQVLSIPGAVKEMMAEPTAEALTDSFVRHIHDEPLTQSEEDLRSLFHVYIQNEDYFRDILQVFNSMSSSTAVVLDAQSSSIFLSKLPLFSAFWTDNPKDFNRLIVALVSKNMVNETIRRIERITGSLKHAKGILLTVQELFYAAGSLEP